MLLFYVFCLFLARIALFATLIQTASRYAVQNGLLPFANIWLSIALAWAGVTAYDKLIRPLSDPWRHLPIVEVEDIRMIIPVTDVPRGEITLEWALQCPDQDLFRLRLPGGKMQLFILSPTALRDLFSTNQGDFRKPPVGRDFLARLLGNGLILSEGNTHARQRKHLSGSFRIQNVRALHSLMLAKTEILLKTMERANKESSGKGIDICEWASKVTLDIIGVALMSKDYDSLRQAHQPVNESFTRLTAPSAGLTALFLYGLAFPQWVVKRLPVAANKMISDNVQVVRQSCEASLAELRQHEKQGSTQSSDILDSIVADPEASHEEIIDQMISFLGAGHETTSTSISWVTHLLTLPENAKYQTKLRDEIRAYPDCAQSSQTLENMPWLNAICEETLRMFPPVTSTAREAFRDTSLAGVRVPKGEIVTVFPWAVNRLPRFWGEDAGIFTPERWLDKKPDGSLRLNNHGGAESNYCNLTFLHGNRSCIGKGFAKAELRLVIAKLYGEFKISRLPGDDGKVIPAGSITIKPQGGLFITMERAE